MSVNYLQSTESENKLGILNKAHEAVSDGVVCYWACVYLLGFD